MQFTMFNFMVLIISTIVTLTVTQVSAHGYLSDSCMTRGALAFPSSALYNPARGYPLVGSSTGGSTRPYPDSLPFVPDSQQTVLKAGPLDLVLRFGNGANHNGPCTATIGRRSAPGKEVQIGSVTNCAKSLMPGSLGKEIGTENLVTPAVMRVVIPQGWEGVQDAYIRFQLLAQHISVENPEIYQDICDIKINEATGSNTLKPNVMSKILTGWPQSKLALLNSQALAAVSSGSGLTSSGSSNNVPVPAADDSATSTNNKAGVAAPIPSTVASVVAAAKIAQAVDTSNAQAASLAAAASPVIPPVPSVAGTESVPASVYAKCGETWNQCNLSWLQNGAKGSYRCQQDYTTCVSSTLRKRMHRHSRFSGKH